MGRGVLRGDDGAGEPRARGGAEVQGADESQEAAARHEALLLQADESAAQALRAACREVRQALRQYDQRKPRRRDQEQGRGASCQAQGHPETPEGAAQDTPHQGGGIHT